MNKMRPLNLAGHGGLWHILPIIQPSMECLFYQRIIALDATASFAIDSLLIGYVKPCFLPESAGWDQMKHLRRKI